MPNLQIDMNQAQSLAESLGTWLDALGARQTSHQPVKPDHYRPFHWPPHQVSFDYLVPNSEWHGRAEMVVDGETYSVSVARTGFGIFGRCDALRAEAKSDTEEGMIKALIQTVKPLLARRKLIGESIDSGTPFTGSFRDLDNLSLLKLFFCSDRSVAHDAQIEIETRGNLANVGPALITILNESRHKHRRTAQWLVLDLFEDLPSYFPTEEGQAQALEAIKQLLWTAEDDYARTVYKAGVVLGGHVCTEAAANVILECVDCPSRIGRRSAMHASFHLCEWLPSRRPDVLRALRKSSASDKEPILQKYCTALIKDIETEQIDHVADPIFPDEP